MGASLVSLEQAAKKGPKIPELNRSAKDVLAQSGGSFLKIVGLIPDKERRKAIRHLYAFFRVVDDKIDNPTIYTRDKSIFLLKVKGLVDDCYEGICPTEGLGKKLFYIIHHFALPKDEFTLFFDELQKDIHRTGKVPSKKEIASYARAVAAAPGLLSARILGVAPTTRNCRAIIRVARYLQAVNIARDVQEDWQLHRIYIPEDFFATRYQDAPMRQRLEKAQMEFVAFLKKYPNPFRNLKEPLAVCRFGEIIPWLIIRAMHWKSVMILHKTAKALEKRR